MILSEYDKIDIESLLKILHIKLDTLTEHFKEGKDLNQFTHMLWVFNEDTTSAVSLISEKIR